MIRRLAVALGVAALTSAAYGQVSDIPLTDKGTTVRINAGGAMASDGVTPIANTGVYKFQTNAGSTTVDDLLHMVKQSYYYRIGNGTPVDLNSLTPILVQTGTNQASVRYEVPGQFRASVNYTLTGGAVGTYSGSLSRTLSVVNLSTSALDFHLFDYTDMNLTGMANTLMPNGTYVEDAQLNPDRGQFVNAQTAKQWDTWFSTVVTSAQVTVNQAPNYVQMGNAAALRNGLSSTPGFNLAYSSGSIPTGTAGGDGSDIAFAFQWDMLLVPTGSVTGTSYRVTSTTTIVPEPGSIALLAGGVGLVFGWRRRKA